MGALHEKRLVAMPFLELRDAARRNERKQLPVAVVSEIVGSPIVVQPMGDALIIATTNVRTLVKVPRLLVGKPAELSIADAIGSGQEFLEYGSMVPLDADRLLVTVGFGTKVAVVEVRASTFAVVRSRVFDDRFAGSPKLCSSGDSNRLFLTTSNHIDVLDVRDLRRVATVDGPGRPGGLVCVNGKAWVSDFLKGTGQIYDVGAKATGSFTWRGEGAEYLFYAPQENAVFGTDGSTGTVFACQLNGGACKSSPAIGNKPTDLLYMEGSLVVTLEAAQRVAFLTADMRLEGTASFPDLPRTMTHIRV